MSESILVPVTKDGDYLEVHPSTLAAHKAIGWQQCQRRETNVGKSPKDEKPTRADLDKALGDLPDDYTDPEEVVNGMRRHFGELFTEADEAKVRELVKVKLPKLSDGLKVDEIKAELKKLGIEIPEGVTLKADLAALLDDAPQG